MTERIRALRRAGPCALIASWAALGAPGPAVAQQSPIGVTSELFDSAFHARIDAPAAQARSRAFRFLDGRVLLVIGGMVLLAATVRRRRMPGGWVAPVALLAPRSRGVRDAGREGRGARASGEIVIEEGDADEAWKARLRAMRKEAEPVSLPPHVAHILQRNAERRPGGASRSDPGVSDRAGDSVSGDAPADSPPPPGSVDLRLPGWGPRGENG